MTTWLAELLGGSIGLTLTAGDAALLLVLGAAAILLFVTGGLATGAVALRSRRDRSERSRRGRFTKWQERLHRVLYDGGDSESLWTLVDDRSAFDFLHFLVQYARRLEGEERRRVCTLAEPYLMRLVPFLRRRSETRRARAVQMLGELGLPNYAPVVISALNDPSPMVAMVAANTLARAETPEYAAEVLRRLDRFAHWRQDFLVAMIASMGERAAPAMRQILMNPAVASKVRAVAADALAMLSDPQAADPAAEVLATSQDVELRAATVRVLAKVGRATHLEPVRTALAGDEMPVRLAAIRALGHFGVEEDLPALEEAAKYDPSPWIAIAAARALKQGSGIAVLEALAGSEHPRAALGLQVMSEAPSW